MRIALLMKRYSLFRGGGEYDLVRLSRSLADRGREVHLFVHELEGEVDSRLHVHIVPMTTWWAPLKIRSFALNAPRKVAETGVRFDVVHAMTQTFPSDLYWNGGGLQINWLPARYGPNALRTAWLHPRHAANLWVERKIFEPENYRRVVSLTSMEREQITGHYGVPESRFHVIPNGVDPERFNHEVRGLHRGTTRKELGIGEDVRLLLFVGTDGRRKGLPQLFQALGRIPSSIEWVLLIVGNDPPSRWSPIAGKSGVESRVRFLGRQEKIERLYAAADLTILASIFEGYGNVVPEAMACGCPVLTTRRVGAADLVNHGTTGWILEDCDDITAYACELEAIMRSERLSETGERAAQEIASFTWEWTVDRLEEVYSSIAEEKGSNHADATRS